MQMLRLKNLFGMPDIAGPQPSIPGIAGGDFSDMFAPKSDPYGNLSFGPQQIENPQAMAQMSSPQQPSNVMDIGSMMGELYKPETAATDRFNEILGQYPQMEKPGWLKVIGATLADRARPGTGMSVIEGDRGRKLADWKNQIGPARDAASLERQSNVNERTMAYQTISQQLRANADEARANKDEARTKIMADRAEVYRLKSLRGNFRFDFSGPEVLMADPNTGKVTRTGISTGSLSEADKMALQQEDALERIGEQGAQTRKTEELRQTGREGLAETRGWTAFNTADGKTILVNQITGETKPLQTEQVGPLTRPTGARGTGVGQTPAALKVQQFNAAREFKQRNPDLGKYIKLGSDNNFDITTPGGWSGPTKEQYDQIVAAVHGENIPINQPGRTGATTKPQGIRVRDPKTGKTGTYTGTAEQAKKAGLTVIG